MMEVKRVAPKMHVKKGDKVRVIAGKDKGKEGKVLTAVPSSNKVFVEGVNIVTKNQRPSQQMPQGGTIKQEAAITSSNVMLVCPGCREATRLGHKILDSGRKVRTCKKCGEVVDK